MRGFPLSFADSGKKYSIEKVMGSPDVAKHLQDLGFTNSTQITVDSRTNNGVVIKIKETKLALSSDLCLKIYVTELTQEPNLEA